MLFRPVGCVPQRGRLLCVGFLFQILVCDVSDTVLKGTCCQSPRHSAAGGSLGDLPPRSVWRGAETCGHLASYQGLVRTRVSGLGRATVLISKAAPKTPGPQRWPRPRYFLPVEKAGQRPAKENPDPPTPTPSSHQHRAVVTGTFSSRCSWASSLLRGLAPERPTSTRHRGLRAGAS